jgi:TPR repeat protein
MRRQDIQLLALARQGDAAARSEAGRRYLVGGDGFPRHIATGMEYLSHPSVRERPETARTIAENLPLQDLLQLQQEDALLKAATAGSLLAQFKLGVWSCLQQGRISAGQSWLEAAAAGGHIEARQAIAAVRQAAPDEALLAMVQAIGNSVAIDVVRVTELAARQARETGSLALLQGCLQIALAMAPRLTHALSDLVVAAVLRAEREGQVVGGLAPEQIEASLEMAIARGDRDAACLLGRALCGIDSGLLAPASLTSTSNMRKGVALLLRAADAGRDDAWLDLYTTHADHRLSVSNPQMARFFLEKAATLGQAEAQRKLGALILRSSASLAESEQAIGWLHAAADQNDVHAQRLLASLVLPVEGDEAAAREAIEQVRLSDPWLAVRLTLARDFGLTKLEALSVDPVEGRRPWGLVVGQNPFITQAKLSAPRAVPALTSQALQNLTRAAAFFDQSRGDGNAFEGDLRRRSVRQRRAFERLGLSDELFFATASSTKLESFRQGPKWAFRAKQPLELALAD